MFRVCRLAILHDLKLGGHQPRTGVHHLVEMMGTAIGWPEPKKNRSPWIASDNPQVTLASLYHGHGGYPLVNIQKAVENGPVEIVDLPSYIAW